MDHEKHNILGVMVNATDYDSAVTQIISAAHQGQSFGVTALAVHGVMAGVLDSTHQYRLNQLHLVVPDGQPVRWALNLLYKVNLSDRVYGPNLMLAVCKAAAGEQLPIFLYGSKPEVLEALSSNLQSKFPNLLIAGKQPSRFRTLSAEEKQQDIQHIIDSGAKIVFVGLGCPRQEIWVYEHLELLPMPMLAVGAAFDFHAGTLPQAPAWMQKRGLEWLYRFLQEPRRLWKRYVLLNPTYLLLLFLQWSQLRKYPIERSTPPLEEIRYG